MILSTAFMCLAMNIYHENRGDTYQAQSAVAQVTMNRARWNWGNVCKTVMEKNQFSWTTKSITKTADGYYVKPFARPKELKAWETAQNIAFQTLNRDNAWLKATHYHAINVHPDWANKLKYVGRYGQHLYYTIDGTKHQGEMKYAFNNIGNMGRFKGVRTETSSDSVWSDGGLPSSFLERIFYTVARWYEQSAGWANPGNATV